MNLFGLPGNSDQYEGSSSLEWGLKSNMCIERLLGPSESAGSVKPVTSLAGYPAKTYLLLIEIGTLSREAGTDVTIPGSSSSSPVNSKSSATRSRNSSIHCLFGACFYRVDQLVVLVFETVEGSGYLIFLQQLCTYPGPVEVIRLL